MSWLWRLLAHRAGNQSLPRDIGPDPEPDDPGPEEEAPPLGEELPSLTLRDEDFARAAAALNVDQAVVRAVAEIESAGRGFLPDGRPSILYEAHVFHRETKGRFPTAKDSRGRALSAPRWDRTLYGAAGAWQWTRLEMASALDWDAAHRSASWGLFQVLGQNVDMPRMPGHPRIAAFVQHMARGAGPHLDSFSAFVLTRNLAGHLRSRNWRAFAKAYNGPAFERNNYHTKLEAAWRRHSR